MAQKLRKRIDIYQQGKFAYFLNAVLYTLSIFGMKVDKIIRYSVYIILGFIFRILTTRRFYERWKTQFYESEAREEKQRYRSLDHYAQRDGSKILWFFSIWYFLGPLILFFKPIRNLGLSANLFIGVFGVCFVLIYIGMYLVERKTIGKYKYWSYFKEFDKQDDHWHKLWRKITFAYCIGGILLTVICTQIINHLP